MAIRDIVKDGEEILRKKSRVVTQFDSKLARILDDMFETMKLNRGVGLAAPQIGYMRRFAICEMTDGTKVELINPVVIESKGEEILEEGCLSVPDKHCNVIRPNYLMLKYQDRKGKTHERLFEGYDARVCCHEMDHLDGILFYDKEVSE
ncbi:MAG: peptide deformylase [Clostridia bacterium]|nr:peptide deformylase [Clostridia bacterium]